MTATLGERIPRDFYARPASEVAPELVGAGVEVAGVGGVIVEAEAYEQDDPACHAFVGITERTRVLYGPPGHAYVYLCYGIHRMFNLVCGPDGSAGAVLVRALEPTAGLEQMRARRGRERDRDLCSGPGKLCQALAVELVDSGADLCAGDARIALRRPQRQPELVSGPRIGITRAADYPWRWCESGSRWLSAPAR